MKMSDVLKQFAAGKYYDCHRYFGAHRTKNGVRFRLWAPQVKAVFVTGSFCDWKEDMYPMTEKTPGIWECCVRSVAEGDQYKYVIDCRSGERLFKADPVAFEAERPPGTASVFADLPGVKEKLFVNVAKGIEQNSWLRISEMVREELGEVAYAAISGPSHAEEVIRKVPTLVTAASAKPELAELVQSVFMNGKFRVYTSADVVGVELGGALKNVFAVAAGILDGMKLGDNPKAALMTRGIHEMGQLGELLGGEKSTFAGLSGIGDLIVTCCSGHSRNRHVGEELGRGKKLPVILREMGMVVAEGVTTAKGAYALARQVNAETPIIDEINAILYDGKDVAAAIEGLMTRAPKRE